MVKLFIFSGSGQNQSYELLGNNVLIGRSAENDIQLTDMAVSRQHLRISEKDGRLFIKDLHSRNGTFVNSQRLSPGIYYEVNEDDSIVVGMTLVCTGKKCIEDVTPFVDSLSYSLKGDDEEKKTTFHRPFTEIKNRELIQNVNNVFHVSSDVDEITAKLIDHILDHFLRVDRVVIVLCSENSKGEISEAVISRSRDESNNSEFSREIVESVMTHNKPLMIPNVRNERENELSGTLKLLNIGSVMCAPILKENTPIGVLYIDSHEKPYGFRGDDLDLITELSDITARAIDPCLIQELED